MREYQQYYDMLRHECDSTIISRAQPFNHYHIPYEKLEKSVFERSYIQWLEARIAMKKGIKGANNCFIPVNEIYNSSNREKAYHDTEKDNLIEKSESKEYFTQSEISVQPSIKEHSQISSDLKEETPLDEETSPDISLDNVEVYLNKYSLDAIRSGKANLLHLNVLVENKNIHANVAGHEQIIRVLISCMLEREMFGKDARFRATNAKISLQVLSKLLNTKESRFILIQNGLLKPFLERLHDFVNNSLEKNVEECTIILECLLLSIKQNRYIIESIMLNDYFMSDIVKLVQLRNFKIIRYIFLILQFICKNGKEGTYLKVAKNGDFMHALSGFISSKNITLQKECLVLLDMLAYDPSCQVYIFDSGAFHGIISLLINQNYEIKYLALAIISRFVPSKNASIDSLILKHAFDELVRFFILERSDIETNLGVEMQNRLWKGILGYSMHILAYLSDYNCTHNILLQPPILRQCTRNLLLYPEEQKLTYDYTSSIINGNELDKGLTNNINQNSENNSRITIERSGLCERSFLACLMLSNLSKFKDGKQQIYANGESSCTLAVILKLFAIIIKLQKETSISNSSKIPNNIISIEEYILLPKVVSRILANMSALPECQTYLIREEIMDLLVNAIHEIKDRTVAWNCLCIISNLCGIGTQTNEELYIHETFLQKQELRECLIKYLKQQEDAKLQGRVIRIIRKLSRYKKVVPFLIKTFELKTIVQVIADTNLNEVKAEGVHILINFFTYSTHINSEELLQSSMIELLLNLSLCSDSAVVADACRVIYLISRINKTICSALVDAGILQRLWLLKEAPSSDKIHKYCAMALRNFSKSQ